MKRTFLLIIICSFSISCSTPTDDLSKDQIPGNWIWLESTGGIAGTTETPESTQKTVRLEISGTSINRFVNNNLESNRTYTIAKQKSLIYGEDREMILYENGLKQIYFTTGDRLILIDDCKDCYQSEYQRE